MSSRIYFILSDYRYYGDSLNISDQNISDWVPTCKFCFCDPKYVCQYMYHDEFIYIYDIVLPENDPDLKIKYYENGQYSANKIIIQNEYDLKDVHTWKYMISMGTNIFIHNDRSLSWACINNYVSIIEYLVNQGIDVNNDCFPISGAALGGYIDTVKYLIEKGANTKSINEALISASYSGHIELVKYLVEYGADINMEIGYDNALGLACQEGHMNIIEYLINNGANTNTINEALIYASEKNHLNIIIYLKQLGADINFNNSRILDRVSYNGYFEIVKYLIESDIDININEYALVYSSSEGHFEIVKYLVENGLHHQINEALETSCYHNYVDIAKYLIDSGANIHSNNETPLINTLESYKNNHNRFELIKYLIELGADIHINNNKPLLLALKYGYHEIIKYLIDSGANNMYVTINH
ncbi:putative ankyrin repeat protein [Megavirus lba]|uniref:Putative ankyrin repeat protein n=1 Tax=Megavirus lba TaxID=1235314 RepID=L7Y471_9VIRU|nr:putative ankyrin repeat protein [Megavirus lba]